MNNQLADPQLLQTISLCYKLTGLAKIKGVCEYLNDLLENEGKFIIFAHHMDVLDAVEELC